MANRFQRGNFVVSDLDRSVDFYTNVLGMDVDFIKEVVEEIDRPVIGSGGAPNSSYITEFFLKTHAFLGRRQFHRREHAMLIFVDPIYRRRQIL